MLAVSRRSWPGKCGRCRTRPCTGRPDNPSDRSSGTRRSPAWDRPPRTLARTLARSRRSSCSREARACRPWPQRESSTHRSCDRPRTPLRLQRRPFRSRRQYLPSRLRSQWSTSSHRREVRPRLRIPAKLRVACRQDSSAASLSRPTCTWPAPTAVGTAPGEAAAGCRGRLRDSPSRARHAGPVGSDARRHRGGRRAADASSGSVSTSRGRRLRRSASSDAWTAGSSSPSRMSGAMALARSCSSRTT